MQKALPPLSGGASVIPASSTASTVLLGRGRPEEVASVVLFLVSAEGSFTTGGEALVDVRAEQT